MRYECCACALAACSLGGALATICALDIRLNLGIEDVRLYSYGSPRVGNAVFAEWFREYVKVRARWHDGHRGARGGSCTLKCEAWGLAASSDGVVWWLWWCCGLAEGSAAAAHAVAALPGALRGWVQVRWRFTHNRDMVPSVPIQLMGFRHVAQEVSTTGSSSWGQQSGHI